MYLKRLESIGFKSFAERVNVEFVPGMTAIVGPNGSGKSNITDAIRWVLGEQSIRSLRGSKMEDIIFQGSDTRNPLNVAEVTLILDNSDGSLPLDYDEVSVTRRVYRSGDSEFYINKQSCRLRDIIDLFMDSGLGREAFSIISQGKVEEVLRSHAVERRAIFEEAAGVSKYKQRKEKAEYKLVETEENLSRVDDIVYEIEQQIDPLREQSEKAKRYLQKKETLERKEISLLVTEIEQIHEEWEQLKAKVEEDHFQELQLKSAIQTKEAEVEQKRQVIEKADKEIEQLQNKLLTTTQQVEQFEGQKKVWHERRKYYLDREKELKERRTKIQQTIKQLKETLTKETKKVKEDQAKVNETKQKIKQLQIDLADGIEPLQEEIENQKAEYIELLNIQAALRNEKQTLGQWRTDHVQQDERFSMAHEELLTKQTKINEQKKHINGQIQKKQIVLSDAEKQLKALQEAAHEKVVKQNKIQQKIQQLYQRKAELKSRETMLREMQEDFQGFFYGVKNVLKARDNNVLKRIYGAVVELIQVPEKYTVAIETSLGGQAQNIVVSDEAAAREAIEWLKKTKNGRATFLPLQAIRSRLLSDYQLERIRTHPGFVDLAANLVETKTKFSMIQKHLLGNVLIAENLQAANEIARILQRRHRVVTLEGDIVNPGGSMTGGGQQRRNQSLFTREKELKQTTEQLARVEANIDKGEELYHQGEKGIEEMEMQKKEQEDFLQQLKHSLQTLESQNQTYEMENNNLKERLNILANDRKLTEQDKEDIAKREKQLTDRLKENERAVGNLQGHIETLTEEEANFAKHHEQMKSNLHRHEITLAEQVERKRNQQEQTTSLQNQLVELHTEHDQCKHELTELERSLQAEDTMEEIDKNITDTKATKEKILNSIQDRRSNRLSETQWIADEERELKEQQRQYQQFTKDIQQKEVRVNRLDVALENRLTTLETDYTITFEKAQQTYPKITNLEQVETEVESLKRAIKKLGTVNMGAIDEYERLSERYDFLAKQKEDLVEAKETLFSIIEEMDQVMRKRFEETFSQIQKEFSIVFKELFSGGHATLSLTDPNDLLETGIDIIAQPPGKKLQQLDLLSGGERSLTAIALLFAILRTRPVPFCVLDEVEAALDEANVTRFAKYVKLHSVDTQFIVITHQKGTMEEADVLYGVTMQESGVSRLVSVQLEEMGEFVSSS